MVKMFELELEVIMNDAFTEKEVRNLVKDTLLNVLHLSHVEVSLSEKKCKNWIIDRDLQWDSPKNISIFLANSEEK